MRLGLYKVVNADEVGKHPTFTQVGRTCLRGAGPRPTAEVEASTSSPSLTFDERG